MKTYLNLVNASFYQREAHISAFKARVCLETSWSRKACIFQEEAAFWAAQSRKAMGLE